MTANNSAELEQVSVATRKLAIDSDKLNEAWSAAGQARAIANLLMTSGESADGFVDTHETIMYALSAIASLTAIANKLIDEA